MALPPSFDLDTFLDRLARRRGRPIKLEPWSGAGGSGAPCGLWFATETTDYICYEPGTSPLHREQIILHECAHILYDHHLGIDLSEAGRLMPDLGSSMIQRALARTSYTSRQEQEAEMLASLLALRTTAQPSQHDGMVGRLTDSLGSPFPDGPT
ncbi:hypothetical protein ACWDFH_07345 [Streptomyces kronopolitis]